VKVSVFEATDQNGVSVSSQSILGKPALCMFYRGNWCPLCMAQVKEIAGRYRELSDLGVQVILVSPQPHKNTASLAAKFDVPFTFLTDSGNKVGDVLDIAMANGLPAGMEVLGYDSDTVLPTVIATDANGKILFADQTDNYRVRPESDIFISIFAGENVVESSRVLKTV
jgi:peroxiredoxin